MPVILKAENFDAWLESKDTDYLQTLLVPYAELDIEMYPVSPVVNNPAHDSAELLNRLW